MTLLALLRHHGDVIEADVQREYGVDLSDLWRGTLSLRRVRVLINHLPADCATAYTLAGEDMAALAGWRLADLLAGRLADELAIFRWQWEGAHTDPKKHQQRQQPPSVLPKVRDEPERQLRLVRPSELGNFVNDPQEVTDHGD